MKISVVIIGLVVLVSIGTGVYLVTNNKDDKTPASDAISVDEQADVGTTKVACDVFTPAVAREVMGASAVETDVPLGQASSDDVSVTNCAYEATHEDGTGLDVVSVLVRGAKTNTGRESNVFGFNGNADRSNFEGEDFGTDFSEVEKISGIGDDAFYDPDFMQVNVLVKGGDYWLIIQGNTHKQSEQLAKLMVANL